MDIAELRKQIDDIDHQIIDLLAKRASVAKDIGKLKHEQQLPPLDSPRWQEVMADRVSYGSRQDIPSDIIEKIWNTIHSWILDIEKQHDTD